MKAKSTESSCSALSRRTVPRQDDKANTDPRTLFPGVEYRILGAHGAWHGRGALAVAVRSTAANHATDSELLPTARAANTKACKPWDVEGIHAVGMLERLAWRTPDNINI